MRRKSSRIIAIVLVMTMVIATLNMNTSVRAEEAIEKEIATSSDAESESIKSDEEKDSTKSEEVGEVDDSEEEQYTAEMDQEDLVAFSQSQSVDGVRVTVTASEGAFPEGATLSVNKVTDSEKEQINQAVEAVRDDSVSVAEAYTFDIKVLDENGTELQPANGQTVSVSFAMDEVSNQNLSTDIYHIPEGNGSLVAEELSTSESGNTVTAVSDGFSYYTVEFTYDEKQYVMEGDTSVALTDILSYVGITKADGSAATDSDITSVSVSDESLFSASNESGEWIVTAHQAFHTDEWMKVTVDGVEYEIKITDSMQITITIESITTTSDQGMTFMCFQLAPSFSEINNYNGGDGRPNWGLPSYSTSGDITITVDSMPDNLYFYVEYNNGGGGGTTGPIGTLSNGVSNTLTATYSFSQAWPVNVNITYATATIKYHVNKASAPTVTAPTLATNLTYSKSAQQLITNAGSTSGNNMQYGISSSSTTQPTAWYSSITDSNLKRTECGTYYVWYKAAATGNYTEVVPTYKGSVTITQKEVGLSWSNTSFVYDGSVRVPTATATGLNSGDTCTVTVTGGQKNAGNYTATASGLSNSNYKLPSDKTCNYSINKANLTVTAKPKTIIYGEAPANDGVTYSGFKGSDSASSLGGTLNYNYTYSQYAIVGNTYKITPGGLTSGNYNISYEPGTLTVNQKEVGLIWSDTSLTYNGSPQKPTANATGLVNGDVVEVTVTGEQTNAGDNYTATASVLTGDKAGNYKLPASNTQSFSINGASMSDEVSSTGYTGTYDATAHNITVNVPEGATVKYRTTSSGDYDLTENPAFTDAGTYTVYYQVTKANYETVTGSAPVQISPKELTLTWGDETSFTYNGSPQVPTATISGVINGDDCTVSVNGAKTDYSASPYTATAVLSGAKKGNYKLTAENTKPFTISKKTATITANDQIVTYGTSIASTVDQVVTEGLVTGDTLTAITMTPSTSDVTTDGTITPSAAVIKNGDTDVKNNYNITYNTGSLTINKKPITISGITASNKTYDGTTAATLNYSGINWADCGKVGDDDLSVTATGAFSDANIGAGKTVTISDLTLSGDKADNYELASSGQQTSTTADITTKALTIKADSDSKVYDGTAHTKNSYSVTSGVLADGDTIESVTVTGSQKYAGSSDNVPSAAFIKNSSGVDVTSNYNITYMNGTIEVTKKPLTITADSDTKVYDTEPLTKNSYTHTALAEGDTIESVTVTGSQTAVGESANVPSAAVIKNGDNDVTANYDITYVNGTLKVTKKVVTITADSDTKVYDGTPLTKYSYTVSGLEAGDRVDSVTITGSQTKVGIGNNVPSGAVIKNANDDIVTANYDIQYANGSLEVTKKTVTITADSETKVYDGTPLTKNSYTNTDLAAGDSIESVTVTGSQTIVGTSNNVPSAAVIKNADGDDATTNYDIQYVNGSLKVTKKAVTITADSDTKTYDGTPLTKNSYTVTGLATGDTANVTIDGTRTDYGTSDNVISSVTIVNSSSEDVTDSYEITRNKGTLTVNKRNVTLTSATADKKYDGQPLTNSVVSVSGDGFVDGEGATYSVTGAQTNAGSSTNSFTYTLNSNTAENNYEITKKEGTLTVSQKKATIKIKSLSKTYGEADPEFEAEVDGAVGSEELSYTLARAEGENVNTYVINATLGSNPNYDITVQGGMLKINPKPATITADDKSKTYGEADPELTATVTGNVDGETLDYTVSRTDGENYGEYAITVTPGSNPNYEVTTEDGTFTIGKRAVTITAEAKTKTYGDADPEFTAKVEGEKSGDTINYTLSREEGNDVGEYKIVVTPGENGNYIVTTTDSKLTINPKAVKIDATDSTKLYGDEDPEFEYTLTDGESLAYDEKLTDDGLVSGSLSREKGEDVGAYNITVGSLNSKNYTFKVNKGQLEIKKRQITVKAEDKEKDYGEADPELTYVNDEATLLFNNDTLEEAVKVTLSREEGEKAGEYTIKADSIESKNYDVTFEEGTFTIKRAESGAEFELDKVDSIKVSIDKTDDEMLDIVLTDEDRQMVKDGAGVRVYFDVTKATASAADKTKILSVAGDGAVVGDTYNIDLFKKFAHLAPEQIHTISKPVTFTFALSGDMTTVPDGYTREYKVVTIHDGQAKALSTSYDDKNKSVSFPANEFSIFAVTYIDTPESENSKPADVKDKPNDSKPGKSAKTGDMFNIGLVLLIMIISAIISVFIILRKRILNKRK